MKVLSQRWSVNPGNLDNPESIPAAGFGRGSEVDGWGNPISYEDMKDFAKKSFDSISDFAKKHSKGDEKDYNKIFNGILTELAKMDEDRE